MIFIYSFIGEKQTYENGDLFVRLGKWVGGGAVPGSYDESAIDGSPEEGIVGVPPQGAFLPGDVKLVGEVAVGPDGALCDHRHPIVPTVSHLIHSMPGRTKTGSNIASTLNIYVKLELYVYEII